MTPVEDYAARGFQLVIWDRDPNADPKTWKGPRDPGWPERQSGMAFSRMQDIGGCRAVVGTATKVDSLVATCEGAAGRSKGPELIRKYDYISSPKSDGYRGVHLIYRYRSAAKEKKAWNGLRIEVQIRSRLQHAWASAQGPEAFRKVCRSLRK